MNISERSETKVKNVDSLIFLLDNIPTYQLAETGDPLDDADATAQAYHIMKQVPGESTNKYYIRMNDKVKVIERIGLEVSTQ